MSARKAGKPPKSARRVYFFGDGKARFHAITYEPPTEDVDADYPLMYLADLMFGGDTKSRLWMRIREKDGLSYGVNTGFNAGGQAAHLGGGVLGFLLMKNQHWLNPFAPSRHIAAPRRRPVKKDWSKDFNR